jgi:hypothetical protein
MKEAPRTELDAKGREGEGTLLLMGRIEAKCVHVHGVSCRAAPEGQEYSVPRTVVCEDLERMDAVIGPVGFVTMPHHAEQGTGGHNQCGGEITRYRLSEEKPKKGVKWVVTGESATVSAYAARAC